MIDVVMIYSKTSDRVTLFWFKQILFIIIWILIIKVIRDKGIIWHRTLMPVAYPNKQLLTLQASISRNNTRELKIIKQRLANSQSKVWDMRRRPWLCTDRKMRSYGTWSALYHAWAVFGLTSASSSISFFPAPAPWSAVALVIPRSGAKLSWSLDSFRCWQPSTSLAGSCQSIGVGWSSRWESRIDKRYSNSCSRQMRGVMAPSQALDRNESFILISFP